jgi:hypothetical protein
MTADCSCGAKLFTYRLRPASKPGHLNIFTDDIPHPVIRADSVEEAMAAAERALPLPESMRYIVEDVHN